MAIHLPLCPYNLNKNPVYTYILDTHKLEKWDQEELSDMFGQIALDQVIDAKYLFEISGYQLIPSYKVLSSPTNLILRYLSEANGEIRSFRELMLRMPPHLQSPPLLKNLLSFLINFEMIQYYTSPGSALTYFLLNGFAEIENTIDEFFKFVGDELGDDLAYRIDPLEHANEIARVVDWY